MAGINPLPPRGIREGSRSAAGAACRSQTSRAAARVQRLLPVRSGLLPVPAATGKPPHASRAGVFVCLVFRGRCAGALLCAQVPVTPSPRSSPGRNRAVTMRPELIQTPPQRNPPREPCRAEVLLSQRSPHAAWSHTERPRGRGTLRAAKSRAGFCGVKDRDTCAFK